MACRKQTFNWYCEKHCLAKEAGYGVYDLEHLDEFPKKDREFWRKGSEDRLLQFTKYMLKEVWNKKEFVKK